MPRASNVEGGVHVDVSRKTLGTWQNRDSMGIFQALPGLWAGRRIECGEDRFEEQLKRFVDACDALRAAHRRTTAS
jgi:hypothetical protein